MQFKCFHPTRSFFREGTYLTVSVFSHITSRLFLLYAAHGPSHPSGHDAPMRPSTAALSSAVQDLHAFSSFPQLVCLFQSVTQHKNLQHPCIPPPNSGTREMGISVCSQTKNRAGKPPARQLYDAFPCSSIPGSNDHPFFCT